MASDPVSHLCEVLEAERTALADGAFDSLADLAERKAEALASLADAPPGEPGRIEALQREAARNARLLEAAGLGLRAAIDRLTAMRRVATHLDTYTAAGARTDLALPAPTLEKRA
jgi:hypothetical protein